MMLNSFGQVLLATLLAVCLASFGWGMQRFFSRPGGYTRGMRVTTLCGLVFAILHFVTILTVGPLSSSQLTGGAVLYLAALSLYWWAILSHGSRHLSAIDSSDAPQHLVEHGPYRFIRHPFYTSYLLAWTAGVLACGQAWLVPTVAIMVAIYLHAADFEERKFSSTPLAAAYAEYRSRTGLFLPNPFKLVFMRESRRGGFNAARVE